MSRQNVAGGDVVTFAVRGTGLTEEELSWFIDDTVNKRLFGVPGVGAVRRVGGVTREVRVDLRADAVQGLGRVAIPQGPDLVAVSAHKIHGPKAIGALWMRAGAEPAPFVHGGGQERGLRSGTLSPALCVGFGAAIRFLVHQAEQASGAHAAEHVARHVALAFPLVGMRLDFARDELRDLVAQQFVVGVGVDRIGAHGASPFRSSSMLKKGTQAAPSRQK